MGVWVSITGYGRQEPGREWIAFGDDAAVAAGLVAWHQERPYFCADAVADPLTGITAAVAALEAFQRPEPVLLDMAMAKVAADFGGPTLAVPDGVVPVAPEARPPEGRDRNWVSTPTPCWPSSPERSHDEASS